MAAEQPWETFLDWYGVWPGAAGFEADGRIWVGDAPTGVRLSVQPAERSEPFLRPERPWESGGLNHLYVRHEDGRYRMWYAAHATGHGTSLLYATSDDGFAWERSELGMHEFDGKRTNNILHAGGGCDCVFVDPDAPPAERYKAFGGSGWFLHRGERVEGDRGMALLAEGEDVAIDGAVMGLVSPDGLRWTRLEAPLFEMFSDGQNIAYYDAARKVYVGYFRLNMFRGEGPAVWPPNPRRCVGRAETADFRRWPKPQIVLQPDSQDPPTDDFYGNGFSWHLGGVHQLMFPSVFHRAEDTLDAQLVVSRDGVNWTRPGRVPIIGLDEGEHGIYASPEMVPLGGDRWGVPYLAVRRRHNEGFYYRISEPDGVFRWATWKRDRLVALEAPAEGRATLLPRVCEGGTLRLNYRTAANGWVRAELVRPNPLWPAARAGPLAGFSLGACQPLRGDELEGVVRWEGGAELGALAGQPVCVRLEMVAARVFAASW